MMLRKLLALAMLLAVTFPVVAEDAVLLLEKDTGYRGIWYYNQATKDEYVYKYSGGLGTYCAKHIPLAIHAPEVNKTFFVYGGTWPGEEQRLIHGVSFFDHATGQVPRPTILLDKKTSDAHDNPVLAIDGEGHLWVFSSSHGTGRPSYISRSTKPYDIDVFELVETTNFSYPQPWYLGEAGFFFPHTYYAGGRGLNWNSSTDGRSWTERTMLAHIAEGHYQISWPKGGTVGTAFNYHPKDKGLNWRTNLYYVETPDLGKTWVNASGESVETPITTVDSAALAHKYEEDGWIVYLKDLNYDAQGRPVILHLTSKGWQPGPDQGPHTMRTAHWRGTEEGWVVRDVAPADNNYDTGCIHIEEDGTWRVIAPTETGPQAYNPGGEMAVWVSTDQGGSWTKERQLTTDSPRNHTYARRPLNAHPGFYAFWADGHGRQPSESYLYFYSKETGKAYRLPYEMEGDFAIPEAL
jgi:hypothetical protein